MVYGKIPLNMDDNDRGNPVTSGLSWKIPLNMDDHDRGSWMTKRTPQQPLSSPVQVARTRSARPSSLEVEIDREFRGLDFGGENV